MRKTRNMQYVGNAILLSAVFLFLAGTAAAQAPPGPLTPPPDAAPSATPVPAPKPAQVTARKSIMGMWELNRDESDKPRSKDSQGSGSNGSNRGGPGGYGGPRMGGTWPGGGMGGGGYGGHRGMGSPQGESSDAHNRDTYRPADQVTLTQRLEKDPEIDLADDRGHKQAFFTDGRKLQDSKDSSYQQIAAHWDGNKLVTDEKGPHGGKVSRAYELSPNGMQLWETVQITPGKSKDTKTIRYVYDAVDEASAKQAGT